MTTENSELKLANDFIRQTDCSIFLTGKAGTGKTTFLQNLRTDCPKRMAVTAPTGVAAINAGGVTLHSLFQLPFGPLVPGMENGRRYKYNREKINLLKNIDLLVIDEISMVRADILDGIDDVLRRYRRSNGPFGGLQLLLIGDLHQLPPVAKPDEWRLLAPHYESPYFFSSHALKNLELLPIELQHIYRQEDSHFINLLNQVRNNSLNRQELGELNKRHIEGFGDTEQAHQGYITLCSHNASADRINHQRLEALKKKSEFFTAEIEGEFPEHTYPTPDVLELKTGAQVMFVRNDSSQEKLYFNGKIGTISTISDNKIGVRCADGEIIQVEASTWDNIEYTLNQETLEIEENKIGSFTQHPLKLAWAITIHKSQGLTFDKAIIDANAAFAHGQVYVALSRCRSLEGLVLSSPITESAIKTDRAVVNFSRKAKEIEIDVSYLEQAKIRYQRRLLVECFDFGKLRYLFGRLQGSAGNDSDLVRIAGTEDLLQLYQTTLKDICNVGDNFGNQLRGLFQDGTQPTDDPVIKERIEKAHNYFISKLEPGIGGIASQLQVETDNKEIRKRVKNNIKKLQEEAGIKLAAVKSCENGFETNCYLRAISSADIQTKPKRTEKTGDLYSEADVAHPQLFTQLKEWRIETAQQENVAHFQVLHQKTLVQIAVHLPDTMKDLKKIRGIGNKLAEKYGEDIIQIVGKYRREQGIADVFLPMAKPVKKSSSVKATSAPKDTKNTKQMSLDLFEQGFSVQEIAEKRELVTSTIEGHLSFFVEKGELEIKKIIPQKRLAAIEKEIAAQKDSQLKPIKERLGEDYSFGEIKLVLAHLKYRN